MSFKIIHGDCVKELERINTSIDLTFLDPPFNQGKEYAEHEDNMPDNVYWKWMQDVCSKVYGITSDGGSIYFMQREKNIEQVLSCLRKTGWNLQNIIIWKKKTSAVPCSNKFGKHYQIIVCSIKGNKIKSFNKLRINPPLPPNYKYKREEGVFITDVWDDIRELTSGYFAGDEAIRRKDGTRFHKQQAPIQLLLRIILSSTNPDDTVLDPFAGTGTTGLVAEQLRRNSIVIEKDLENVRCIEKRLKNISESDDVRRFYDDYIYSENLDKIWGYEVKTEIKEKKSKQLSMFGARE
jgi:DNA modification methylase